MWNEPKDKSIGKETEKNATMSPHDKTTQDGDSGKEKNVYKE